MDNDLVDMPEVPDVPDDEDDDDFAAEEAGEGEAASRGRLGAILAIATAPLGAVLGPVGAILSPVVSRVPSLVLTAVVSALTVIILTLVATSLLGGGTDATTHVAEAHEELLPDLLNEPIPTRPPIPTPKPIGPSPTPTPSLWEPHKDGGWVGRGYAGPSRLDMLMPSRFLLFDDRREAYTIVTRFSILTATGPGAPLWGVALSYHDEGNHLLLESRTGKERHPEFSLVSSKDGQGAVHGPAVPAPELPYWGRDVHELRISTNNTRTKVWLDELVVGQWENKHIADGGRKGLFAWFGAVLRVESFEIQ